MKVTLTKVNWIAEADALCTLLEGHGIETFLPDQGTVMVNPLFSNAIGGIRIQVEESDLAQAREILKDKPPTETNGLFTCPNCGSDSVEYEKVSKRFAYLTLLFFGIPLLWLKKQFKCNVCGHRWKEKGQR